jgi:hypothetical protein
MQLTFEPARLTRLAIAAVAAATALSLGACGSSHDEKSPSSSSSSTPGASKGKNKDVIQGQVASVSGNAVQVTEPNGTTTVDLDPAVKVIDYTNVKVTDVAAGNCASVFAKSVPSGPAVAVNVTLSPPGDDGKCPKAKPAAAGSPGAPGPDKPFPVVGTVASVAGNIIKVDGIDANGNPSQTEVIVTAKTPYIKGVPAASQAIAQGRCISARGTLDKGGTLQAAKINLTPANAQGKCPESHAK